MCRFLAQVAQPLEEQVQAGGRGSVRKGVVGGERVIVCALVHSEGI